MTQIRLFMTAAAMAGLFLVGACSHFSSGEKTLPATHPEALAEGRVSCSECHRGSGDGDTETLCHLQPLHQFYCQSPAVRCTERRTVCYLPQTGVL